MDYSVGELMVVAISRTLRDGEVCVSGANSAIPMAACRLAQLTHAPNLTFISGGSGAVNSRLGPLPHSSCDAQQLRAESVLSLSDVIEVQARKTGLFFTGGLQIDQYGNCNMVGTGAPGKLTFRGPGSAGLLYSTRACRSIIYTTSHTPRTFVSQVDFVSAPGHKVRDYAGGDICRDTGIPGRAGPVLVVTPLCVMDFEEDSSKMRISSIHPHVSVQDVLQKTGFTPVVPEHVHTTRPPTAHQVEILRKLDPEGVLLNIVR